jgi:hypothetical protein
MAKTAATRLQDEVELVRREAFAAGYAAAMKLIREFASRSKPGSATRSRRQRGQVSAAQPTATRQRQSRSAARSRKDDAPARRSPRGTNARLVVEVLEAISPRAARPSEIREALRGKGIAMAATSIQFALGQLQARRAVEQVADTTTWRYLGKAG